MDALTFITPASVRLLLVPINELSQTDFEKILDTLKRVKDVRAVDLINNPGRFNPQAYPQGHLYFNFITRDDDTESLFLHDFEPFRKTAIVIGVAKWNSSLTDDSIRQLQAQLKKKYPSPISHFSMIFDCPKDFSTKCSEVYTVDENTSNMETKICDISSRFLSNFSTYASAYEHTTLRSPGSLNDMPMKQHRKKISSSFDLTSEKSKQILAKGRKLKLSGNFYLMAGNLKTALSDFCEAIYYLKLSNDSLWLASALDGLAVCIFLLSSIGAPYQLPQFINSLLDTANAVDNILISPINSPKTSMQINGSFLPSFDIGEESASLSVVPLETVIETAFNCGKLSSIYYEEAKTYSNEYIPQIVIECLLRYASLLVLIKTKERLDINVINKIIYTDTITSDEHTTDDFDLNHFNKLCFHILNSDFSHLAASQQLRICFTMILLYSKTNMQMKKCLMIKKFLDIVLLTQTLVSITESQYKDLSQILSDYCENYGIQVNNFKRQSPNFLQKKILLQIINFCFKIKYMEGYIYYGSLAFRYFHTLLPADEQIKIYKHMKDYCQKTNTVTEYWDPYLFLNFEFEIEEHDIVEGENCQVYLLLRNPFAFEIEIKDLNLSTADNFPLKLSYNDRKNSQLTPLSFIFIKPFHEISVPLILAPEKNGMLHIDGLIATVSFCKNQKFFIKNPSVISFLPKLGKSDVIKKEPDTKLKNWEVNVVYKQPFLKIIDVKLSDKWIMLLDGEKKQFTVILKNISNTEINYLISKFKDSTTDILTSELSNKSLHSNEIYEIEYQLLMNKTFKILNKKDLEKIEGNETFSLDIEITGKMGVQEANFVLEYSHQKDTASEFKRSLNIPVHLTVYQSIELSGCDIIPLTSNTKINENNIDTCWKYLEKMKLKNHKLSQFCLLALDFVNMWSEEMEVCVDFTPSCTKEIEVHNSDDSIDKIIEENFTVKTFIPSRKNIRIFVPLLRMNFDDEFLNRRIPSLRNKQFVIDNKTPMAEQIFIKHAFWYKEEILKRINATWRVVPKKDSNSNKERSGVINMRSFRFSSRMIEVLEVEKIKISLKLLDNNDEAADLNNVKLNKFYKIHLQLTNNNKNVIFGMLRHIPICKDPPYTYEKKILINGVLQFSIETPIKSGERRAFDLGIVFLEKGEYEWGALFDQIDGWENGDMSIQKQYLQREQLKFKIR